MNIFFSPLRTDDVVDFAKAGDAIYINGEPFDLSPIEDGDTLPKDAINSNWFAGDVTRKDGQLIVTLTLPNPWNYSHEQAYPVPLFNVPDGTIELPKPLPDPEPEIDIENEGGSIDE